MTHKSNFLVLLMGVVVLMSCSNDQGMQSGGCVEKSIIETLRHGRDDEKADALQALAKIQCRDAVPVIVGCLNDGNDAVRSWAAWALGEIGDSSAIEPLIVRMEVEQRLWENPSVLVKPKAITDIYMALEKLTGQRYGLDVMAWRKWYDSSKGPSSSLQ